MNDSTGPRHGASGAPRGGRQAAGGRALESTTNNSSAAPWEPFTDHRWSHLDWLRDNSVVPRQRRCMVRAYAPLVGVRAGAGKARYTGLMACGGRCCPVCGPALYARNGADIAQCVRAWTEGYGGTVLLGTFTAGHEYREDLASSTALIAKAWAAVTSGRGWVDDRRAHGVTYWVRVFEEKWSPESGWHAHLHYLLFVEPGYSSHARELLASMYRRWSRVVIAGGRKVSPDAQDLHEVDGAGAAAVLGDYLTKQTAAPADEPAAELTAATLGHELTNKETKRGAGSFTPGELLQLAIYSEEPHLRHARWKRLWNEYEAAMQGRRVIGWSRGLRQWAGIGDEADGEAEALEAAEREGELQLQMFPSGYRQVMRHRIRKEVLQRVVENGATETVAWLRDVHGIEATSAIDLWLRDFGLPAVDPASVEYAGDLPF